ncbi:MAG: hypothetical protein LIO86_14850, partial [Lachnospiraceae bacterium]|nr:hypothetical protein [Lachnospiraceae bacterium]
IVDFAFLAVFFSFFIVLSVVFVACLVMIDFFLLKIGMVYCQPLYCSGKWPFCQIAVIAGHFQSVLHCSFWEVCGRIKMI